LTFVPLIIPPTRRAESDRELFLVRI
jgi:hypothetical protein